MRLLLDAQLPVRLGALMSSLGHDVTHTSDLPAGNRTDDSEVSRAADASDRIVVTKDRDFLDSHLLAGRPARLLLVATGNISNNDLLAVFSAAAATLEAAFAQNALVEISQTSVVIHG